MANLTNTEVVTGEVRLSYTNLFTARAPISGGAPKYSATLLIPKSDTGTYQRLTAAIEAAIQAGVSRKWNGQRPPVVTIPLHDGDGVRPSDGAEFGAECKGHWVMTASCGQHRPPQVVDAQRNPIINQALVYSGMYAHVYINFYPYFAGGKKGIGCVLNAVQKTRDGEPLGGTAKDADEVFSSVTASAPPAAAVAGINPITGQQETQQQINPITGLPYIPPIGM